MSAWWSADLACLDGGSLGSTIDRSALWLMAALVRVTIDGALVAVPVWLACRFLPALPASVRAWLWWGVSLKLLLSLAAAPALSIPVLPASLAPDAAWRGTTRQATNADRSTATPDVVRGWRASPAATPDVVAPLAPLTVSGVAKGSVGATSVLWQLVRLATIAWMLAVATRVLLLLAEAQRLRGIRQRATRVPPAIEDEHEDLAKDLGLTSAPALRESDAVTAPQVIGLWRPTVLLPAAAPPLSPRERTMVLCHELAHVRRRDLALGWIPALAERLLVWHPLAGLCAREYVLAREAACDALVLHTLDAPAHDYGRLLVRLGVNAPAARIAAAGTSPTAHLLHRRLRMLQQASLSPRAITGLVLGAAVVALLPLRLAAVPAVADPAERTPRERARDEANAASPSRDVSTQPRAMAQRERERERERRDERDQNNRSWILLYPGSESVTMNGDTDDIDEARRLRGARDRGLFVFRRDGATYTIEDEATLARIAEIFEPQRRLGERQAELGSQQGVLGAEQSRFGMRQGTAGAEHGELSRRQAELAAKAAELGARQERIAIDRLRREERLGRNEAERERADKALAAAVAETEARHRAIERELHEIEERHAALSADQEAIGREQDALARRQEALGAEQERLGAEQERAAKLGERALTEEIERAIAAGVAKRVR